MIDPGAALARFVRWVMRDVTYHRCFRAVVERANLDGSVEVSSTDPALQDVSMSGLKVAGLPGCTSIPAQGAACLVAFEGGDPRRPYVMAWDTNAPGVVRMGGDRPIARMTDIVEVKLPPVVTVTGTVTGVATAPGPTPVPIPPAPLVGGVVTLALPPSVQVQTGNPKLLA